MSESKGKFRVGVDIGGTFINKLSPWFAPSSPADAGVRLAQHVVAADAFQDRLPACRIGTLRRAPSRFTRDSGVRAGPFPA